MSTNAAVSQQRKPDQGLYSYARVFCYMTVATVVLVGELAQLYGLKLVWQISVLNPCQYHSYVSIPVEYKIRYSDLHSINSFKSVWPRTSVAVEKLDQTAGLKEVLKYVIQVLAYQEV